MKMFILAASVAALTISMPVAAESAEQGKPAKAQHSKNGKGQAVASRDRQVRTDVRTDRRQDQVRYGDRVQSRTSARDCPPGLAKKSPACVPPGQAKRLFNQGQRVPAGYNNYSRYNQIPERYRSRVPYSQDARYIYRDDRVYIVNPTTRLVTRIIDLFR